MSPRSPDYLAIRTCDRPGYLQRLLHSLSRREAVNASCALVFDDSRREANRLRNRQIVDSARRRFGFEVKYLGESWQQEFIATLLQLAPEAGDSIRWLLAPRPTDPFTGGRLFNLIILALAGHRFNLFDDDFLLDRARHLGNGHTRTVRWSNSPAQLVRAYPSIRASRLAGAELDADPIDMHLEFLGRRLQDCLVPAEGAATPPLDATRAGTVPPELRLDEDSVILTTVNGQYGVPAAPGYFHVFTQAQDESRLEWEDPAQYRLLRQGRAVWNVTSTLVVSGKAGSTPSGLDNRQIVPPTIPYGRGEDTLLCVMLKFVYPNAAHLYLPWGLEHSRQFVPWAHRTFNRKTSIGLAATLWKRTERLAVPAEGHQSAETRLQSLARYWQDWSAQPHAALADDIRGHFRHGMQWRAGVIRESLAKVPDPRLQVHRDLARTLALVEACLEPGLAVPGLEEHPAITDDKRKVQCLAEAAREYGRALDAWPRLWRAAKELQAIA